MKKTLISAILFVMAIYPSLAQITINRSDFGKIGDKFYMASDTTADNISIGAKGLNVTWDFSQNVKADTYDSTMFVDPINFPNFPVGANMASINGAGDTTFFALGSTEYKVYIPTESIPFPLPKNTLSYVKFPLTYLNTNDDQIAIDIANTPSFFGIDGIPAFIDSIRISFVIRVNSIVDGSGTLKTPLATYPNVLRLKSVSSNTVTTYIHNTITRSWTLSPQGNQANADTAYIFLGQNMGTEIMTVNMDTLGNISSIKYLVTKVFPNSVNEVSAPVSLNVYPNPANDAFSLQLLSNTSHEAIMYMTDVNGKIIRDTEKVSVKTGYNSIQVSNLYIVEGFYFCHLEMDGVHVVKKILIGS
jgi:hypothetical protein